MATLPSPRTPPCAKPNDRNLNPIIAQTVDHPRLPLRGRATHESANRESGPLCRSLLFANILPQEFEEIICSARQRQFCRGNAIHLEGDPVQHVVLLMSGSAKVVQFCPNGSEVILRLCGPGELVGTLGLSTRGRHCSTAQAIRLSEAYVWDSAVFERFSERFAALRLNTALLLGKQLRDMEERFREISTERVAARLSHQLVRLMHQVGHRENGVTEISITREELAQLIGTTLFTVSRLLSDWDKQGIIKTRRRAVCVCDLKALEILSENVSQLPLKR